MIKCVCIFGQLRHGCFVLIREWKEERDDFTLMFIYLFGDRFKTEFVQAVRREKKFDLVSRVLVVDMSQTKSTVADPLSRKPLLDICRVYCVYVFNTYVKKKKKISSY